MELFCHDSQLNFIVWWPVVWYPGQDACNTNESPLGLHFKASMHPVNCLNNTKSIYRCNQCAGFERHNTTMPCAWPQTLLKLWLFLRPCLFWLQQLCVVIHVKGWKQPLQQPGAGTTSWASMIWSRGLWHSTLMPCDFSAALASVCFQHAHMIILYNIQYN